MSAYSVDWELGFRQDGDSAWEKKQNVSKSEEAAEHTNFTANKTSKLGRPFPLRDRNKVCNSSGFLSVLLRVCVIAGMYLQDSLEIKWGRRCSVWTKLEHKT